MTMTNEQYLKTQMALINAGGQVVSLDLPGFIERARMAESVGAVLDPTLYRRGHESLQAVRELAEAASKFRGAFMRLQKITIDRIETEGFTIGGFGSQPQSISKGEDQ